jgi:activator of 2-hydroxyglutaryl-CoA dehydratase
MAAEERSDVRVVAAELGERAGAVGAALLGEREASEVVAG